MKRTIEMLKAAIKDFGTDQAPLLAAALAYYTTLSLAPALLLLVSVAALLGSGAQQELLGEIGKAVGPQAADLIGSVLRGAAARHTGGLIGTAVATVTMLLGAGGVFAQLQHCLNRIWDVEAIPGGIWLTVRKRATSLGLFLILAIIVALSTVVGTAVTGLTGRVGIVAQLGDIVVSLLILTALFAFIYRYVPDVRIGWPEVWFGAFVTALLFTIGKFGIGLYLSRAGVASAYGAAGSLILILLWIYYSSLIVFFGAELTQVHARVHGRELEPQAHARRTQLAPAPA